MDCIFCQIIAGEIPSHKIYEDEDFFVMLDINPVNLGHALILPKKHFRNLLDMPDKLLKKQGPLIKKIALAVKDATGADGINIGWNNEPAAGQLIFHSHVHIIPRFRNDGFKHWRGKNKPLNEELVEIARNLMKKLIM